MYAETEAFLEGVHRQMSVILTDHLVFVLTTVLNRLSRYDEGNLISSILTLAVSYSTIIYFKPISKMHHLYLATCSI